MFHHIQTLKNVFRVCIEPKYFSNADKMKKKGNDKTGVISNSANVIYISTQTFAFVLGYRFPYEYNPLEYTE